MPVQFFVFVVESPSAPDLYHGRSEGELVSRAASLDGVPCVHRVAIARDAFTAALQLGLADAMKQYPDHLPVVHISAHGYEDGIQLSNREVVSWDQLRELLVPINKALSGFLIVCMSACKGYAACRMAMRLEDEHPYWVLVANYDQPTWSDTAVAYSTLYHLLRKGKTIPEAVEAMKVATADPNWVCETAHDAKTYYLEFVKNVDLQRAGEKIEEVAAAADVPADAKALERTEAG